MRISPLAWASSLVVRTLRSEIKVSSSSPAASYVQRWAVCSNLPANAYVSVEGVEVVERS